jgi:hypothetical protein
MKEQELKVLKLLINFLMYNKRIIETKDDKIIELYSKYRQGLYSKYNELFNSEKNKSNISISQIFNVLPHHNQIDKFAEKDNKNQYEFGINKLFDGSIDLNDEKLLEYIKELSNF